MKAKKILSILLVFVLCFSVFAGCKSGRDKNSNTTPQGGSGGQEELEDPSIRTSHISEWQSGLASLLASLEKQTTKPEDTP